MEKKKFKESIADFIENSTCSFTCVKEIKRILKKQGFKELKENEKWNMKGNKFYVIRNDASIIAIEIPFQKVSSFLIITSHLDTPSLLLKLNGNYIKENYLKANIMPYGGLLNYGWLDHPLSLSGRIIEKNNNTLKKIIIDFKKTMLIIPSVAIHQNDKANSNLDINAQIDMQPIMTITKNKKTWDSILKSKIKGKIIDYDLYAYSNEKPVYIGLNEELLVAPRIDNLTSVYTSLISFIESKSKNIKIFCSFNSEEIGSLTEEGADSNFLIDVLKRICVGLDIDLVMTLSNSFVISADNTHAIHPNHTEFSDDTGALYLNDGFAIIKETLSTTNSLSVSVIKTICDNHRIKYQYSTARNDQNGGSTLSGISLRHVSVLSIDVGVPQLAMHSSLEVCSINDVYELYRMMKLFYESAILKRNDIIEIM